MFARRSFGSLLLVASCHCGDDPIAVPVADGASIAPIAAREYAARLGTVGAKTMLVPFTDPSTDIVLLADEAESNGLELILGLTPSRSAEAEWNAPSDPAGIEDALDRAALARARLAGVHVDHAEPGAPREDQGPYLDSLVTLIRSKTDVPISFAIRARAITSAEVTAAGFPAPPRGTAVGDVVDRTKQIEWASGWGQALASRFDRVVVHVGAASDRLRTLDELGLLKRNLGAAELWVTVDAASAIRGGTSRVAPARSIEEDVFAYRSVASRVLIRNLEALTPETALGPDPRARDVPIAVEDPELERRAGDMDRRMRRCCLRDGQIVTVYDGRFERDQFANLWQEDACWLTSLYASAMSFRFAVTKDPEAEAEARAAWRAIHQMANTTPMKGEVVRNFVRALYTQTAPVAPGSATIKRWRRATDREIYWVGDISVDQLSGWFNGVFVYHDLVATADEREEIAADIRAVLDMFLANDLRAIEFTGEPTTFGDLRAQPLLALAFFQIGFHITKDQKYRDEMLRLMDEEGMHFGIGNVLSVYHSANRFGSDHFYSSGFYPLMILETDPKRREDLDLPLQIFHELKRRHGDAYADTVYAVFNPGSDTARRASRELIRYRPELSENAGWMKEVGSVYEGPFDPIDRRLAGELDFDYVPPGPKGMRGGLEHRYSGVGYMLPYWMARYHGLIQIE